MSVVALALEKKIEREQPPGRQFGPGARHADDVDVGEHGAIFFFSSSRRHTIFDCDWSSDVCSSDLLKKISSPMIENNVARTSVDHPRIFLTFARIVAAPRMTPISIMSANKPVGTIAINNCPHIVSELSHAVTIYCTNASEIITPDVRIRILCACASSVALNASPSVYDVAICLYVLNCLNIRPPRRIFYDVGAAFFIGSVGTNCVPLL